MQAWGEGESFPNEGPKVKEVRFFVEFQINYCCPNWLALFISHDSERME